MKIHELFRIMPAALLAAILFSGCSEKSECENPARHAHEYEKEANGATIKKFVEDEHLWLWGGYNWTENCIELTKTDAEVIGLLSSAGLFYGEDNWSYLYNTMASNHDYLKFYYEYETTITIREEDEDGNVTETEEVIEHKGWTTNPKDPNNTGETRLYHHRYVGYKVIHENGRFRLEKSSEVDDIRDIIDEYPYFSENCVTEVYATFHYRPRELPYLDPNDFDTFKGPDLSTSDLNIGDARVRKNKDIN